MEWGGQRRLLSIGFQVVNFPDFITPGPSAVPGDPTAIAGEDDETIQTVKLSWGDWQIKLVALPESRQRYARLSATGGYAFTHVGELKRSDANPFSVEQAKDILESLRVFLSFARGAACCLPVQWGRVASADIVWRQFVSPIVDGWMPRLSWFDEHHGGILAELFEPFRRIHRDSSLREPLVVTLHWYRHCNTQSSGMEGSLVLGMAALDLLGALIVVDRDGSMTEAGYDKLHGAKKLRKLLGALEIQVDIPERYEALTRFAQRHSYGDSCKALVELRNGFVHAVRSRYGLPPRCGCWDSGACGGCA